MANVKPDTPAELGGIYTPVLNVALTKERMAQLPADERGLLILFGSAANQLNMLRKLVIFSSNKSPDEDVEGRLSAAQTQMLVRLNIGTLFESWKLIETRFLKQLVGKDYVPLLDVPGTKALDDLKDHFGKSNLLSKLRNSIAFHYPENDRVEAAFNLAAGDASFDDDWCVYLAQSHLNSFFFGSDVVVVHAILHAIGEADLVAAQKVLMDEMRLVTDALIEFIYSFFGALWTRRFGQEMDATVCADTGTAPDLTEPWIPFFVQLKVQAE